MRQIRSNEGNGRISYSYTPESWNQDEFLRLGGYTVVFLNYNKGFMIERSVQSTLNQDYPLLEMFFMDDASSDGSGDRMEELVRAYRGRHKVSVVRNDENQYITGQWNIVSKLATGKWLGMFCGDDIAHPDRVSLVAQRIAQYPSLLGVSTAAVDINPETGLPLPDKHYVRSPYLAHGNLSPDAILKDFNSNGSTSFWHRSLFSEDLPRAPLDDSYLHLIIFAKTRGVDQPVFLYDSSIKTIDYSCGVGVCAQGVPSAKDSDGAVRRWYLGQLRYKKYLCVSARTFEFGIAYAVQMGLDASYNDPFRGDVLWKYIRAGSTFSRIALLPRLLWFVYDGQVTVVRKLKLIRSYLYFLIFELLGLHVAAQVRFLFRHKER